MVINWYGEGCFKVQTGGLTLLTDPEVGAGLTAPRGKNDIVLKTLSSWPIHQPQDEETQILFGPGEYEIKGIEISGFGLTKESAEKFFKTVYLVKAEDLTLCFLGHLADDPGPETLGKIKGADLVFMPAGGKPFVSQELAAKLVKQLDPKIVVASFFKIPGLKRSSDDFRDFAKELGQKAEPEEKLVIKRKEVAEQKGLKLAVLKI